MAIIFCDLSGSKEKICFDSGSDGVVYVPGSPAFERLVSQLISTGLHYLGDGDMMCCPPSKHNQCLARQFQWQARESSYYRIMAWFVGFGFCCVHVLLWRMTAMSA